MAFDPGVAERLREALRDRADVSEKRMFGGIAFMLRGHMLAGVVGEVLMARVGPPRYADLLRRPHAREMDFTGKPLKGFIYVDPPGFAEDADLAAWLAACLEFNATQAAK